MHQQWGQKLVQGDFSAHCEAGAAAHTGLGLKMAWRAGQPRSGFCPREGMFGQGGVGTSTIQLNMYQRHGGEARGLWLWELQGRGASKPGVPAEASRGRGP